MSEFTFITENMDCEYVHVHAASCADTRKAKYVGHNQWTESHESPTQWQLVESVYADHMSENEDGRFEQYFDDVRIFPCCGELPVGVRSVGEPAAVEPATETETETDKLQAELAVRRTQVDGLASELVELRAEVAMRRERVTELYREISGLRTLVRVAAMRIDHLSRCGSRSGYVTRQLCELRAQLVDELDR
jgi:hypothetical protein